MWDKGVSTPVGLIAHGGREVNNFLADGQYFFVDILREGIVLYELDDRPLAEPKRLSPADALRVAREHFEGQTQSATEFQQLAAYAIEHGWEKRAAFLLH